MPTTSWRGHYPTTPPELKDAAPTHAEEPVISPRDAPSPQR